MYKVVAILVVVCIGYFVFLNDTYPNAVYVNGQEFGPKTLERSNDSNSKLFSYGSKSLDNRDQISILFPDEGTGDLSDWSDLFSRHFASQGFTFKRYGINKMALKDRSAIYMVPVYEKNVIAIYIVNDIENSNMPSGTQAFEVISSFQFN